MSYGIKIYGMLSILFSIYMFYYVVDVSGSFHAMTMFLTAYLVTALCWLVFGVGVLMRFPWARIGLIAIAGIYIIDMLEYPFRVLSDLKRGGMAAMLAFIGYLFFFISLIIFFTRPRVKKQFSKDNRENSTTQAQ